MIGVGSVVSLNLSLVCGTAPSRAHLISHNLMLSLYGLTDSLPHCLTPSLSLAVALFIYQSLDNWCCAAISALKERAPSR